MPTTPADSLLVIDIGNTRIGLAVADSDGLHDAQRVLATDPAAWTAALEQVWAAIPGAESRAIVIAGVQPTVTRQVVELAGRVCGVEPLRVRDDLPLPMPLEIDNPAEVGVDRICSAAAAHDRVQQAVAVASFGTAITIDCVSEAGQFLGGVILPGLDMMCAALHERTAALPRVRAVATAGAFARNTHDAIVAGVIYGAVGALREVVERFATDLRQWPQLVLTGGDAPLIAEHANFVDSIVPDLCLMGVALTYRRAAAARAT